MECEDIYFFMLSNKTTHHTLRRFQWVFCQLEMLRHAVQPDVRAILKKLPKTLDETYERVLKNINENNREHARHLLHCISIAVRPLYVEELAEILTLNFDAAEGGIPKFCPDRRLKDQEEAVLSICSSLITIVDDRRHRVVQFSHLSVKEFLTSNFLVTSTGHLSTYHIRSVPAHTLLAQASLALLLYSDDRDDNQIVKDSPLAMYAARHWVTHAQFEDVASHVEDGMKSLFDLDRPHFVAWISLYNIDDQPAWWEIPSPLYYSALCGFHNLVRHIAIKHPEHVNASGGSFGFPLVAALCRNHFRVAEILLEHGGRIDVQNTELESVLHLALYRYKQVSVEAVKFLLKHGADVNAQRNDNWTPLHLAVKNEDLSVSRVLLEYQANVHLRNHDGQTPLHLISSQRNFTGESYEIVKLLLECGANVSEKDYHNMTPLHLSLHIGDIEVAWLLLDHGARVDAVDGYGKTPLHNVSSCDQDKASVSVAQLLLGCGGDVNAQTKEQQTPLHFASQLGKHEIVCLLLNHGAKVDAVDKNGETPLHLVSGHGHLVGETSVHVAKLLLEYGGDVNAQTKSLQWTPLLAAAHYGNLHIAQLLLDNGAKIDAMDSDGNTPLHHVSVYQFSEKACVSIAQLLLKCGGDVNTQIKEQGTPLHVASFHGKLTIAQLLLKHGAKVDTVDNAGETPLHYVSQAEYIHEEDSVAIIQLLLDYDCNVHYARNPTWVLVVMC
jgi:ankyrin repeat protein